MTAERPRGPRGDHGEASPTDRGQLLPTVVRLRAWGYLSSEPGGDTVCSIVQSAVLDDGREVKLSDDRGWTTTATLETLSVAHAVQSLDTALLPDDAEITAETQEWPQFVQRLRHAGVAVDVEVLRAVPWDVLLVLPR